VPNEYEAVWAPETVWTLSEERNILSEPGMEQRFLGFPAHNGLNTPTELPRDLFQSRDFITTLMYCRTVPFVFIVLRPFGSTLFRWKDFHWWIPSTSLKVCLFPPTSPFLCIPLQSSRRSVDRNCDGGNHMTYSASVKNLGLADIRQK
jgi:hypothetical protein